MKVILINPDYLLYPFPPLGLAYLVSYLRKYSSNVDIILLDQISEKDMLKRIRLEKPDIVGFSSTSPHHWKVKKIALKVKKICSSLLILGGIHVTNYPKTIENSPFDIGVLGEGEITFKKLIDNIEINGRLNLKELKKISGLVLKENGKIFNTGKGERVENLDDVPIPARDLLDMKYYSSPSFSDKDTFESTGLMFTSRGCPYNCSFCSSTRFWGNSVKFFSAERVANEIEILYNKYHYRIIQIYDDLFSINKLRLKEIISILDKKGILGKIKFKVFGRGNCFDEEIVILLKELGVIEVGFGIETGSEKILNMIKDKITLQDDIDAINLCRKHGIQPLGAFMFGMPYETEEDLKKTWDFISKYISDRFVIAQMSAFPGTPIWDYAIKNKLIKEDIFEKEERRFLEFNEEDSLSLELPKGVLTEYWEKFLKLGPGDVFGWRKIIEIFGPSNKFGIKKISTLKLNHLSILFNLLFLKKVYSILIKKEKQG